MKKAVTKVRKPDPREAVWTNWRLISEMIEAGRSPSIEDLRIALLRPTWAVTEMEEKGVPASLTAACRQYAVELSAHRQQRHSQPTKARMVKSIKTKTVKRYYKAAKARLDAMLADQKTNAQRGKK